MKWPPQQGCPKRVQAIAAGISHARALTSDGGVRCWGYGGTGLLGVKGSGGNLGEPPRSSVLTGVTAIAAAASHTCALTTAGGVRCLGDNSSGQLGNGFRATPAPVLCQ